MAKDQVFFVSILFFLLGIAWGSYSPLPVLSTLLLLGAILLAGCLLLSLPQIGIVLVCSFLWWGGATLAHSERVHFEALPTFDQATVGTARILADPETKDFFREVRLRFENCETAACPQERILWQAPLSFRGEAGDQLSLSCLLERPKNISEDFDYRMFLAKDSVGYICKQTGEVVLLEKDMTGKMRAALYVPKHVLEAGLSRILSEPEAGLAKGLLLGGDNYLPRSLKESFASVGLSHMIAVSGYNITLLAEMFLGIGLFLGLWRFQALWAALVGVVFFIVMIGMPASAARAGAMAGIVFLALQTGRLAQPLNTLLFAAGSMLFFQPLLLRYDIGFQLSFLATLGILWSAAYQEKLASWPLMLRQGGAVVLMTVAVELFVLPVILFSFHTFSPMILIGNFLVLLVPFAMILSFTSVILFLIWPGAHILFSFLAFGILTAMTHAVEWLGNTPWATFTVEYFGVTELLVWYGILGVLIFVTKQKFFRII
jgi:competence protein ComEC